MTEDSQRADITEGAWTRRLALSAFAFSGCAALIYEVAWTRSLSLILGSTTYALSTMLATFMAGLAIGSFIGGRLADRRMNLLFLFGAMEFGIGVSGLAAVPVINSMAPLFFKIYRAFHLAPGIYFLMQFFLCAMVMIVPTTLMGATFPVVSRIAAPGMERMGRSVGDAYSFNTLGAIAGSLGAGFLLIPLFGVKAAVFAAASLNVIVGAGMMALSGSFFDKRRIGAVILALGLSANLAIHSEEEAWAVNLYTAGNYPSYEMFKAEPKGENLFDKDFREGRVKLWRNPEGFLIVQVGGKVEGSSRIDLPNTLLLAYLPVASHPSAESFLNIGLGTGATVGAAKRNVKDLTLVEINEGVIEAIGTHGPPGLLDGVEVVVNDARNYLLTTERKFDIISSEPSYPSDMGTGNLFTREFYELASGRLNGDGVFCQWMPYYLMTDNDVTMMIKTLGSVFPRVYLWKVTASNDLIAVASKKEFAYSEDEMRERVGRMNATWGALSYVISRTPEQVGEIVAANPDAPLNTDDLPYLEFSVVDGLLYGTGR